jgi:hypothetical protein
MAKNHSSGVMQINFADPNFGIRNKTLHQYPITKIRKRLVSLLIFEPLLSKLAIRKAANTDYNSRKGAKGAKFGVG